MTTGIPTCGQVTGCCGEETCAIYRRPVVMLECGSCGHNPSGQVVASQCQLPCKSHLASRGREACATTSQRWPAGDPPPGMKCPKRQD